MENTCTWYELLFTKIFQLNKMVLLTSVFLSFLLKSSKIKFLLFFFLCGKTLSLLPKFYSYNMGIWSWEISQKIFTTHYSGGIFWKENQEKKKGENKIFKKIEFFKRKIKRKKELNFSKPNYAAKPFPFANFCYSSAIFPGSER